MAQTSQVNWYEDDVLLVVDEATDELVSRIAFQVEGEAKPNAPVDTGFMRNAIYAITPLGNRRAAAVAEARAVGDGVLAGQPALEEREAAVHGAAEYTIFQELRVGFLYGALERVAGQVGGMIKAVGRVHFG